MFGVFIKNLSYNISEKAKTHFASHSPEMAAAVDRAAGSVSLNSIGYFVSNFLPLFP